MGKIQEFPGIRKAGNISKYERRVDIMKVTKRIRMFLDKKGLPYTISPDDNSSILLPYPTKKDRLLTVVVSIEPELGWLKICVPIFKRLKREEVLETQAVVSELNIECAFGVFEVYSDLLIMSFRATMPLDEKKRHFYSEHSSV